MPTTTTDNKQQETIIRAAPLQIENMAIAIAHDIKQPLSAISAAVAAMGAHRLGDEVSAMLKLIESAARDITRMTASLVDCAILGGQLRLRPGQIGIAALLDELRQQHALAAREAGVTLRVISQPLQLHADRDLLSRALRNIISNAILHAQASKIIVRARQRGTACEIDVIDNGIGIQPRNLERIWQLGWSGHGGTGLGLYATRAFIGAMNGTIEARSEPERGTLFRVRLPGPVARLPLTTAISNRPERELLGSVIAMLDDDQAVLEATRAAFSARGARVIAHTSPLNLLHDITMLPKHPDLVLLDFLLGGSQTVETCLKILQGRYGQNLRVVILTAHPNHPDLRRLSGITVMEKPLTRQQIEQLCRDLRTQSSWHELQREKGNHDDRH